MADAVSRQGQTVDTLSAKSAIVTSRLKGTAR